MTYLSSLTLSLTHSLIHSTGVSLQLETLYLDDEMRVHVTEDGNYHVHTRYINSLITNPNPYNTYRLPLTYPQTTHVHSRSIT